jgi:hypothetical protein
VTKRRRFTSRRILPCGRLAGRNRDGAETGTGQKPRGRNRDGYDVGAFLVGTVVCFAVLYWYATWQEARRDRKGKSG